MRQDQTGKQYNYDYQEYFDRSMPRINYSYPLLKYNGGYLLTSNVALTQFLKMDRIYRMMTEEINDSFKSDYIGPAIEQYARFLVDRYARTITYLNPITGGDKPYGPKKSHWKEPDAILETDEFILLIECKANPFSMKLLKDFDTKSFTKTIQSVETSITNINRYLTYHEKRLKEKKVIKMLVFFECQPDWFEMLIADVEMHLPNNGIKIIDFNILESFLQENSMTLLQIIESYDKKKSEYFSSITFEQYLESIGNSFKNNEENEYDFLTILAREYGLEENQ